MPSAQDILTGLQTLANQYYAIAILWHAVFYLALAALVGTWRPGRRTVALFLVLPLLSVAALAWMTGNAFNGMLTSLAALLIFVFGISLSAQPVEWSRRTFLLAGIAMVIFGLAYPHFLQVNSLLTYLFASPAGLIPCPTLAVLIGVLLMTNGLGSRGLMLTGIGFATFYGLIGVIWLGIALDLGLLIGAAMLLLLSIAIQKAQRGQAA